MTRHDPSSTAISGSSTSGSSKSRGFVVNKKKMRAIKGGAKLMKKRWRRSMKMVNKLERNDPQSNEAPMAVKNIPIVAPRVEEVDRSETIMMATRLNMGHEMAERETMG